MAQGVVAGVLLEHELAAAWQQFQLEHVHPANPSAITTKKEKSAVEDKASTSSDFSSTSTTSSKIRKGKNSQTTKEKASTPSEEATPDLLPPDKDEMLVKKIMQILIENNFHETILAQELTKLIVNARRLVSSRTGDDGLLKDPTVAGIASVLLQNDADSGYTVPDEQIVEDTAPIPVEDTAPIPVEDTVPIPVEEPQLLERRKRSKKMIVNVESDSSEHTDDAKNINDDNDVEWTCDIATKIIKSSDKKSKVKKEREEKVRNNKFENVKRMQFENVKKNDVKEDVQVATSKSFRQSDSIIISDDDDDEPITEPPPLVPITKKQKIKEKVIEKQNVPDKKEEKKVEEERVPLHPLILSDDNFIKIVAHMYQRGNSMFSDYAAKIAAQYSTNKARSEYEATGVPIVSGTLYEIAIESLGLEKLKRMHESIQTQFDKPPQPSITITTKNNDDVHVVEAVVEKKEKKKTLIVGANSRKRLVEPSPSPPPFVQINQAIVPEPLPQNVFPVGMFKGPVEVAKPHTYTIPASSLMAKEGSNPGSNSSISLDGQNRVNNTSKPSIVITSRGEIRVNGVPQCQSNSEVTPHVIISPSTPTKDSVSHDQYTKKDNSKKSGKIEVTATQVFSANDLKSLPTQTATNKIVANANNQMMSQPSTSNIYSRNSSKPNVVPQANHRKRSPSPPTDHMQLFKDVVQIQAESYKELPKVQITKTEAKPNVIKILKDDLPKPKSVANTSRDRPVMISKPSSTIQTKGSPACNKLLVILKKNENTKYDTINKSSSSPKVIDVEREAAKKLTASSFIDLADIPERKPKVEKRPAPYVDKSAKKKKIFTSRAAALNHERRERPRRVRGRRSTCAVCS